MSIDPITKDLIACLDGEFVDTIKFFSIHPQTDSIKLAIYKLRRSGYVTIDEGDNRILSIAATPKLLALAKEVR